METTVAPLVVEGCIGGLSEMAELSSSAFKREGGPREKLCDIVTLTKEEAPPGWRTPLGKLSEGRLAWSWAFWPRGMTWENTRLVSSPSCFTGSTAWLVFGMVYTTVLGARELKNTFPCCAVVESVVNVPLLVVPWLMETQPVVGEKQTNKNKRKF